MGYFKAASVIQATGKPAMKNFATMLQQIYTFEF